MCEVEGEKQEVGVEGGRERGREAADRYLLSHRFRNPFKKIE